MLRLRLTAKRLVMGNVGINYMKRCLIYLSVTIVLLWTMPACSWLNAKYHTQMLGVFDTVTTIIGYDSSKKQFNENAGLIFAELEKYHRLFDIYNTYDGINNIKTINDNAGIAPVAVSEKIIDLLELSVEMHELTNGRINIAMGRVLSLWHPLLTKQENADLPTMEALLAASKHCNINSLIINRAEGTVFLADGNMSLDVGAIAKGYAVECAAEYASAMGLESYLINVGGNVRAVGSKQGDAWSVGVNSQDGGVAFTVKVDGMSVVTSGGYNRFFEYGGKKYHHIIDPETLMPAEHCISVTVVCRDSGLADALSTALFNMSVEAGIALAEVLEGVEACYIDNDSQLYYTSGFGDLMK